MSTLVMPRDMVGCTRSFANKLYSTFSYKCPKDGQRAQKRMQCPQGWSPLNHAYRGSMGERFHSNQYLLRSKQRLIGLHLLLSSLGSNIMLRIACCVVGIGLPVYTTFKAIEKKDLEDQEQCLVYWAVYGCFIIVEVFSDMLISWFPLYYHAKLAFLIWLQIPSTFGSRNIYMRYLQPFLQIHQTRLDRIVGRAYNEINNIVVTHQREIQFVRIPIQKMVMAVYHIIKDIIQSSQPWRDGTADDAADRTIERTTSDAD